MRRTMFKSKLHRVRITQADLTYEGSVTIDAELMRAADILPHEKVHIWDINSGSRLETYALEGPAGSGVVCVNGAAARLVQPGDLAIIATFSEMDDAEARAWQPLVVRVDDDNRVVSTAAEQWPGPGKVFSVK